MGYINSKHELIVHAVCVPPHPLLPEAIESQQFAPSYLKWMIVFGQTWTFTQDLLALDLIY